jgi:MFS family permease
MLVVAAPLLVTDVLGSAPESTVYIVSPGALGIAVGIVIAPALARLTSQSVTLWTGFTLVVLAVFLLAWVPEVAHVLDEHTFLPLQQLQETVAVRREIAATMLILPLGGAGMSLVQVASRAAVYELAPPQTIAQVFATQSAIGSVAALLPTLLAGASLDLLDVRTVIGAIGVLMLLAPLAAALAPALASGRRVGRNGQPA